MFCIVGMSPNFSFVKTLVKKLVKISAFSLSLLVRVLLGVSKSAIPEIVFVLLFTYCQNFFRFIFASFAISFSWHFCRYLVTFLTLFLSLLNIINLFSSIQLLSLYLCYTLCFLLIRSFILLSSLHFGFLSPILIFLFGICFSIDSLIVPLIKFHRALISFSLLPNSSFQFICSR